VRRREFLAATAVAPLAARAGEAAASVTIGLERIADGSATLPQGRAGLLGHGASLTADGRHAIDALRKAGVELLRLFGPEHGLRGRAAAGEEVTSGRDESGLPLVSLYGAKTKPTVDDLRGLELLIVDLQDAGVRFYTYASTMLLCLEAAAEAGVEVVVLDRPNPVGGVRVDGPERDPSVPSNLFLTPGPLVHGLTIGELAQLANARLPKPGRVRVVTMSGWARPMTWHDTGREFLPPSPNLRTADAALAYPGTCLVEGTSASEGRGTEAPFLTIGAPWLKAEAVARDAAGYGFALEPVEFTPTASPAAPEPKLKDVRCRGVRVVVADRRAAHPWALGLKLLAALRRHREFEWVRAGATIDTLAGSRELRAAIDRGDAVEAILAREQPAVEKWREARKPFLLY
jgi:uncharacterized protein YbbC (DUF1343 family)